MREVTPRRCARCNPSMLVAGMIAIMSSVATRVTAMTSMTTRAATRMSSGVSSSTCKYRRRSENKDYADD